MNLKSKALYGDGVEAKTLNRILEYTAPKDFSPESTSFHMGAEQTKRDIRRIIERELND